MSFVISMVITKYLFAIAFILQQLHTMQNTVQELQVLGPPRLTNHPATVNRHVSIEEGNQYENGNENAFAT